GSAACTERTIDDPLATDTTATDLTPDKKVHGLRTCGPGQSLYERDADTIFALEFFKGYEALAPLTKVFVKHKREDLLLELLDVLHKHWSVVGGVAKSEPAVAEALKTDVLPALNKVTKVILQTKVTRCADGACAATVEVPAGV